VADARVVHPFVQLRDGGVWYRGLGFTTLVNPRNPVVAAESVSVPAAAPLPVPKGRLTAAEYLRWVAHARTEYGAAVAVTSVGGASRPITDGPGD
jgi:hypothetical protein